jgi:hypothetical protein
MYLRKKCLKMRVLMLGGLLDDERLRNREALQGFEVFPRPYTATALLHKVKDVLSMPRGRTGGACAIDVGLTTLERRPTAC